TVGIDAANAIPCSEFKLMLIKKYCPQSKVQKMESELWNLKLKGTNIIAYTQRFQELALLCPKMVTLEAQMIERYIGGLSQNIKGNVTSSKPEPMLRKPNPRQPESWQPEPKLEPEPKPKPELEPELEHGI
nr:reverse transcriptase domain-containing protein [Tanacetum cinerariifolium]